jgi:hypothetical protein
MKEKIMSFFQSIKVRVFNKRVFNKKTLTGAVIILVIAVALRITFSLMFEVQGVVKKVDGSKITVVNFLTTKTVDIGDFQATSSDIQVGDRIEIMKNLSGEIMNVRDESKRHMNEKGNSYNNGKHNFKGNGERNSMRRN